MNFPERVSLKLMGFQAQNMRCNKPEQAISSLFAFSYEPGGKLGFIRLEAATPEEAVSAGQKVGTWVLPQLEKLEKFAWPFPYLALKEHEFV
jgi:hypothetical protein